MNLTAMRPSPLSRKGIRQFLLMGMTSVLILTCLFRLHAEPGMHDWYEKSLSFAFELKGTVTDADGNPLEGVSVTVIGQAQGVSTDREGKFTITASENARIRFTHVGFESTEVQVKNQSPLAIVLTPLASSLKDVVVVGYGTQSKKSVTGSVSSVSAKQLQDRSVVSFTEAIAGQVAGVQVQQTSNAPGAGLNIKIRGVGSVSADNTPLYVIDGVPVDNSASSFGAQGGDWSGMVNTPTNPMAFINPADIQSIDILKDASATAIYGSRGSNGVVIITTKSGIKGRAQIGVNVSTGWQNVSHKMSMLTKEEWVAEQIDIRNYNHMYSQGQLIPGRSESDPNSVRAVGNKIPNEFKDPSLLPSVNWQDVVFQTAPMSNYQISASGGSENVKYYISGNYIDQQAVTRGNGYKKYSLRSNIDATITKRIKVGIRIAPSYSTNDINTSGGLTYYGGVSTAALTAPPAVSIYTADGKYATTQPITYDDGTPPGSIFFSNGLGLSKEHKLVQRLFNTVGTIFATVDILDNLSFRTSFNGDITSNNMDRFVPSTISVAGTNLYGSTFSGTNLSWSNENTLSYNKTFAGKHNVGALVGFSEQMATFTSSGIAANNYPNDLVRTVNAGTVTAITASKSQWSMASLITRLNYDYGEKYYLTASFRRDGSSRFGANSKWGSFPSVGVSWRVSQEKFMESLKPVSELKLRASYGIVGNDQIGNYGSIGSVGLSKYVLGTGDGSVVNGLSQYSLGNPRLSWEQSKATDLGIEIGLLDNRINITADYYNKVSSGMLFNVPVPSFTGFSNTLRNLGQIRNKGFELQIESRNISNANFTWVTTVNVAANKNRVERLNESNDPILTRNQGVVNAYTHRTVVGLPVASYYGYIYDGVFKNATELANGAKLASGATYVGDPRLKDISGPNGTPDGVIDDYDKTELGNNLPAYTFGITNRITYKNFDFSFLIQGVQGVDVLNLLKTTSTHKLVSSLFKNYWKSEAEPGDGMMFRPTYGGYQGNNPIITSWLVEDGSFVRIRNIALGYRVPQLFNGAVKNARLYVNVENLYTFTNYKGYNPEVNTVEGTNNLTPGMDFGTFPMTRTITVGLNITL
ncbi:MAG: TonB-dependent receptor [Agriterribacter sp.]